MEAFASYSELWLSQKAQKVDVVGLLKRFCVELKDIQPRARESAMRDHGDQRWRLSRKTLIVTISCSIEI